VASFWDATGQLWAKGALVGKFAGIFASSGCQHGGIETTILSFLPNLVHHGMIYVPIGFAHPNISDYSEIIGSGPWGAGTNAGPDGSRQPSQKDLQVAEFQGKSFAELLGKRLG
jgi:NAD(P)H dehydrogenase (quinone)